MKPPRPQAPRCMECAWCDPVDGAATVCRVTDRLLGERQLWRRACGRFSPLDVSGALEAEGS